MKINLLLILFISTGLYAQSSNEDYFQDDIALENPYEPSAIIQEQQDLNYPFSESQEDFQMEEEVYDLEADYSD